MAAKLNLTRAERLGYVVGGIALMIWALRKPSRRSVLLRAGTSGLGGWLLYQAYTGSNPIFRPLGIRVNPQPADPDVAETVVIDEAITISRSRAEVYAFFRRSENLPSPDASSVEMTREREGEELAWRGTRGEKVMHFGSLVFRDAPGRRGTIIDARLEYQPAGGSLGVALAHVMGRAPQRILADSLRRARAVLETGEAPTTAGQPTGRR